jgi:hypothetical protein
MPLALAIPVLLGAAGAAAQAGALSHARRNIFHLGIKELRSLLRDPIMLVLIVYAFTLAIYTPPRPCRRR